MDNLSRLHPLFALVAAVWVCSISGFVSTEVLRFCALVPRDVWQLHGIVSMVLVHKDWAHLAANTVPLAVLGALTLLEGRRYFVTSIAGVVLLGGIGLWLIGRAGSHVGASGLVFGLFALLLARAFYARSMRSVGIATLVMLGYGSFVWGILPTNSGVSWEAHLTGAMAGVVMAKWLVPREQATV